MPSGRKKKQFAGRLWNEKWNRAVIPAGVLALSVTASWGLFGAEYGVILRWYGTWLVLAAAGLPLAWTLFAAFPDGGWSFARPLGMLLAGGLMWALSVFRILPFTTGTAYLCALVLFGVSAALWRYRYRRGAAELDLSRFRECLPEILWAEVMFFLLLVYWTHVKGSDPAANGTEKMMDFGFMMSMDKSLYNPPEDMWFAGKPLNYYYVGQFLATYVTKLSGVGVAFGYNLMMMTLPALGFPECFGIARQLLRKYNGAAEKSWIPVVGGLAAGFGCTFAGNVHYVLYSLFGLDPNYYYPNSTRFIGYNPETADKTIHEFPAYSFVIGDLHAHVINFIFVLCLMGILLAWMERRRDAMDGASVTDRPGPVREALEAEIILLGIFIGMFQGINYWDFPIYYVVAGAVILFTNVRVYRNIKDVVSRTALEGVFVFAIAWLVSFPFRLHFEMIASKIKLADSRTPLYQLAILWGLPILLVFVFLAECVLAYGIPSGGKKKRGKKALSQRLRDALSVLARAVMETAPEDLFMALAGICAAGLILMPELVYVRDIYGGDYRRANTMFKLTFQAFILFSLCFGYMLPRLIAYSERTRIFATAAAILFALTLGFYPTAAKARFGGVFGKGYQTLDGTAFLAEQAPVQDADTTMAADAAAIRWINENVTEPAVVLEAYGDSYTLYGRMSVFTGHATVLGWRVHEWLWRSDSETPESYPAAISERESDIRKIYTSCDRAAVEELLEKYDVSYLVLGYLERHNSMWEWDWENAPGDPEEFLKSLGEVVFAYRGREPLYIIRVNRNQ